MFTGIVEELGKILSVEKNTESDPAETCSARLRIQANVVMSDLKVGDSVTINGACMTALDPTEDGFCCDMSPETATLTNLGSLKVGESVNLERAMRLSDRLSGHMVSGHIEGIGLIVSEMPRENAIVLGIDLPKSVLKYCVPKGSITLDGVSMTINVLSSSGIEISVIPHTAAMTTLGIKGCGDQLNVESDLIGRYVEGLLNCGAVTTPYAR